MANLPESTTYDAGVYQLETTDPVVGGPSGVSNAPLKNLANRTNYLKAHVDAIEAAYAPKASPAFTGNPTAPTPAVDDNDTSLATTAFVIGQAASVNPVMDGTAAPGVSTRFARADHVHPTDTSRAPLASPTFTGTPSAPTAGSGTNTTQVATTAFVQSAIAPLAPVASPTFTGTPSAPTAAAGTNTTQIATTAFIQSAIAAASVFPSGTKLMFAQPAAPAGWTQVTDDSATNRMLRVVNTAGGGAGGTHSPILNNVVPSHTHGFTTGIESANHTHGVNDPGHQHTGVGFPEYGWDGAYSVNANGANTHRDTSRSTAVSGVGISLGGMTVSHTHSGSTDNGSSQTNWTPRYIDMILCSKN